VALTREGLRPKDLVTQKSLENAVRMVCAMSGSTNALIHIAAIAGRAGIDLTGDLMRVWTAETPVLADIRPAGRYPLSVLEQDGGIPAIMRELRALVHLDPLTATGHPWLAELPEHAGTMRSVRSIADPVHHVGALALLSGSLAPEGAIIKRSAASPSLLRHVGPALVFDGVDDIQSRIDSPDLPATPQTVLVLRGAGPRGGPGMPEVGHLPIPRRLLCDGVSDMVRVSDARMSGTATGTVVLHVAPESAVGGPLALVHDGDLISLDVDAGRLDLLVDRDELDRRRAVLRLPDAPPRGYEWLHWRHVLQAPAGCDFDFLRAANDDVGRTNA